MLSINTPFQQCNRHQEYKQYYGASPVFEFMYLAGAFIQSEYNVKIFMPFLWIEPIILS